ncbi:MAG: response regulator transcription factor [Dehalococcoidia bacterium]|nr:MAG: response regulator transcription factor [Dehalococcoidia bacterium]
MNNTVKILLVDDHAVLRAGLKTLLNSQPDMVVIAEADNGNEALRQFVNSNPDIVLMDISMPGKSGIEITKEIKKRNSKAKVLALTMHDDEGYLHQMLRAGANGFVPKKAADTELLDAIRATYRGEHFIHSSMTSGFVHRFRGEDIKDKLKIQGHDLLSSRENEVLTLVAMGYTDQQIANKLYLSIKTVQTYKSRLKEKLKVKGRAELVRYAIEHGLLET